MTPFHLPQRLAIGLLAGLLACTGAARAADAAAASVMPAPTFDLPGDAGRVNLASLKGKVVYLDFWASWCVPCRASFKWLNEMQARYGSQGLVVLAVNVDKDRALAAQFLKDSPAKFLVGYEPDGGVAASYRLKGMPSAYSIDRRGLLAGSHVGFRDKDRDALEQQIKTLLAAAP